MTESKITARLAAALNDLAKDALLNVIIELRVPPLDSRTLQASVPEKTAAMKSVFESHAAPIASIIRQTGGNVVDPAWVNQTLSARVTRQSIALLEQSAGVAAIDVSRQLAPDS